MNVREPGTTKNNRVFVGNGTSARECGKCARCKPSAYLHQLTIKKGIASTARTALARNVKSRALVMNTGLVPCIGPTDRLVHDPWRPVCDPSLTRVDSCRLV